MAYRIGQPTAVKSRSPTALLASAATRTTRNSTRMFCFASSMFDGLAMKGSRMPTPTGWIWVLSIVSPLPWAYSTTDSSTASARLRERLSAACIVSRGLASGYAVERALFDQSHQLSPSQPGRAGGR